MNCNRRWIVRSRYLIWKDKRINWPARTMTKYKTITESFKIKVHMIRSVFVKEKKT